MPFCLILSMGCSSQEPKLDTLEDVAREVAVAVCDARYAADSCALELGPICSYDISWDFDCELQLEQEILRFTDFDPDKTPRLAELCIEEMSYVSCINVEYDYDEGCYWYRGWHDPCDLD